MPKGFANVYLLIGLIAIALIGGAFYVGRVSKQYQTEIPSLTKATPTPGPTVFEVANNDETTNWKTFTSSELGISFKYPNDYEIESETDQEVSFSSSYAGNQKVSKSLVITTKTTNLKELPLCNDANISPTKSCVGGKESIRVGNQEVTKFSLVYGGGGFGLSQRIQTPKIEIYKTIFGGGAQVVFDQVVSTLKFL